MTGVTRNDLSTADRKHLLREGQLLGAMTAVILLGISGWLVVVWFLLAGGLWLKSLLSDPSRRAREER